LAAGESAQTVVYEGGAINASDADFQESELAAGESAQAQPRRLRPLAELDAEYQTDKDPFGTAEPLCEDYKREKMQVQKCFTTDS